MNGARFQPVACVGWILGPGSAVPTASDRARLDGFFVLRNLRGALGRTAPTRGPVKTVCVALHLGLFRELKCIVELNAEVPNGALDLGVPKQQLHRA